jgi:hypothetical protein
MSTQNLWGELPGPAEVTPPVTILREQASVLGKATNNVLVGQVSKVTARQWAFQYDLDIRAAALDDYIYEVLSVRHNVEMYPLEVIDSGKAKVCSDEKAYTAALQEILSSNRVRKVISSLLSLSKSA